MIIKIPWEHFSKMKIPRSHSTWAYWIGLQGDPGSYISMFLAGSCGQMGLGITALPLTALVPQYQSLAVSTVVSSGRSWDQHSWESPDKHDRPADHRSRPQRARFRKVGSTILRLQEAPGTLSMGAPPHLIINIKSHLHPTLNINDM